MPIPNYEELMLPLLGHAADGEVSFKEAVGWVSDQFKLTKEERRKKLPSGRAYLIQ